MAKHDQRILKFLNQNADRAPTITEMMTRLNISISDISDSLGSLQSQGLITKKTNSQGIECWFPTGPQASPQMVQPMQVPAPHLSSQHMPTTSIPILGEGRNPGDRSGMDSRFSGGMSERSMQIPEPQPPTPKAPPVQVQHIPMAEPVYNPSGRGGIPPQPEPAMNGNTPIYGLTQPPSKGGIGFLTFALGLVVAVAVATWLSGRLAGNEVNKAAKNFVDKKALTEATASFTEFQEKTKTHVTALEAEVKKLTDQLASSKAAAESLQTKVATAKPEAAKPEETAKGKAGKKAPAAVAKAKPAASATNAIAKAAARGAAKKRKSAAAKAPRETSEYSSSSSSSESSGSSESSPSVPEPPGLEELPPPPSE
ncbi:MAG: hypothetical protein JWO30_3800 [Fibrobacteres bacterium]|nr:hypothetical protein [Fibrobacterota bacterium]